MTIGETRFQQKFVIADGITIEGILGIDFMEVNKCMVDIAGNEYHLRWKVPYFSTFCTDSQ